MLGGRCDPPPVGRSNAGQKLNALLIAILLVASAGSGLNWWARLHGVVSNSNVEAGHAGGHL